MDEEFSSLQELFKRLTPALGTKRRELAQCGMDYVTEEDIWNYLRETRWKEASGLTVADMVDDILNTENRHFEQFLKNKLKRRTRATYFKEEQDVA